MKKLPECELDIMMIIWDFDKKVSADMIMEKLNKNWTKTTVLNFLTRLCSRGFLSCEKDGRVNIYSALTEKDEYLRAESETFLKKMHNNSLKSLVASLYDGNKISKNDLEELKKYIEEVE